MINYQVLQSMSPLQLRIEFLLVNRSLRCCRMTSSSERSSSPGLFRHTIRRCCGRKVWTFARPWSSVDARTWTVARWHCNRSEIWVFWRIKTEIITTPPPCLYSENQLPGFSPVHFRFRTELISGLMHVTPAFSMSHSTLMASRLLPPLGSIQYSPGIFLSDDFLCQFTWWFLWVTKMEISARSSRVGDGTLWFFHRL